jgi:cysteinyl-tRNA synthetase
MIKENDDLADDLKALIEERQAARKAKDFKKSDEIRDLLLEKGIILEDTPTGVKWSYKR